MLYIVRPWVATADLWDVRWDITREIKRLFDEEGISIGVPQQEVRIHSDKRASMETSQDR